MTTLIVLVLLPIIPAYLLFTTLPSKAAVSGPLKGFRINLSGAFAAYFSLVALLLANLPRLLPPLPPLKWTAYGQVIDAKTSEPIQVFQLRLTPPSQYTEGDGSFRMKLTADLADDSSKLVYPRLVVIADGYKDEYFDLDPKSPALAKRGGKPVGTEIPMGKIALTKLPPYVDPPASTTSFAHTP